MGEQINLMPFLLEAFGENQRIYKDIDFVYAQNKYEFYRLAKVSPFYNHPIILEGDILRQEYGRKMLGILFASINDPQLTEEVFKLIKKGWAYIYRLFEKEKDKGDTIYLYSILKKAYKTHEEFSALPDDVVCSLITIILFLATNYGKKIDSESEQFVVKVYKERLEFYDKEASGRLQYKTFSPELKKKIDILKKDVYEKHGVIKCFRDINPAKKEELNRLTEGFALLFDTEFISSVSLFDKLKFSEKDIDEILAAYFVSQRNLNATEAAKFLVAGIYIKYLLKSYKAAKEHYFKYNRETMFLTLEFHEKEIASLKEKNEKIEQRVREQQEQIESLKKALESEYFKARNEFIKTIQNLERENEQLKAELEADKSELIALRELAFSLQQEPVPEPEEIPSLDEMCRTLNSPAVLIVGGHPGWQRQIKSKLPDATFVSADMLGFDPNSLGKVKLVVFNTAYLNHAMYYKMINFVRKNKIKVCYITEQKIENGITQIYRAINS